MFASVLIIVLCSVLLAFWFRVSCVLLLRNYAEQSSGMQISIPANFNCARVQASLEGAGQLAPLHQLLNRDYQVLSYLVRHASAVKLESFEEKLLVWDYKTMQFWYRLTKTAAPEQARHALSEMASVLTILSSRIGQRAGVGAEA
jgi:hypothetical protein